MAILVSGGAGYIGSCCARMLSDAGYDVIVVDNLSKGHREAVGNLRLYVGNIGDAAFRDTVLSQKKIDGVMHFAAFSLVGESMKEPLKYYENNVGESMRFFGSLIRHNVTNLVFSSTAATYGMAETMPITEKTPTEPINTYGETKLSIEKMLKWFKQAYGLNYTVLRYFNVAGAHKSGEIGEAHSPETHLIPLVLQVAAGLRDQLKIFGRDYPTRDGTNIRDYIHVMDLIDAHRLAFERMRSTGEGGTFNLGSGGGYSNLEILETARRITGKPIPAAFEDRRAGDPPVLIASSELAEKTLGWKRQNGIEQIIEDAWRWHSDPKF